jgi:2-dehydropantoate 2-reductase
MTILVVGAGATGGFFGIRLAQAGRDVTFLVRPHRAETLRRRGLRLIGLDQEESMQPQLVTAEALESPYDTVLLSVKATALRQAIEDLAPAVGPRTRIIPFLNGLAHIDELNARFGTTTVLGGVVKVATELNADGDIVQVGPGASMTVGAQDGSVSSLLAEATAELVDAGFDFSVSDDIITAMWAKWAFISTISAVTCLMRGAIGDVVACAGGAELGPAILTEVAAVATSCGHPIPDRELAATRLAATAAGSALTTSMYRDLQDGNPTEVEQILGDLTLRGRLASRPTPLLDLATLNLRVYEHRRSGAPIEPPGRI